LASGRVRALERRDQRAGDIVDVHELVESLSPVWQEDRTTGLEP
jgi:hypothetical protein